MCCLCKLFAPRRPETGRLIPILGAFVTVTTPVQKTPQYRRWPIIGEVIMSLTLNTVQKCTLTIRPVDARGNPAQVEGVEWLTDNSDVISLEPSEDGLTCVVKAVGMRGTANVQVNVDAQLGEGTSLLSGVLPVEVVPAPATNVVIEPGTPENNV